MDITSNNINQNQLNSYNNNIGTNTIDNNYMNGGKGTTSFTNNMVTQSNNNLIQPSPPQYIPQNNNQTFWNSRLDGSAPNKKRKYVFVEEIDVTQPVFSLEDIRKIVSDEFDRRFGEEEKS